MPSRVSASGRTWSPPCAIGRRVAALSPPTTLTESALESWAASANQQQIERTDYVYDLRGNLEKATAYATTDASGNGVATGASITRYVYDQRGRLLKRIDPRGEATPDDPPNPADYVTTFTYDG